MTETPEAPLAIDGYTFRRALGVFSIGSSYLYVQDEGNQLVHVLLAPNPESLESFTAAFDEAVAGSAQDILLYAGLTNLGRPYVVTDFLDDDTVEALSEATIERIDDQTRISSRRHEVDETLLSTARSPRSPAPSSSSAKRPIISNLVVTERQAVVPNAAQLATSATYSPRDLPATVERGVVLPPAKPAQSVAPPVSRSARERDRAKRSLIAVALSVAVSVIGAVVLLYLLIGR